jgi:hypothetical protein
VKTGNGFKEKLGVKGNAALEKTRSHNGEG